MANFAKYLLGAAGQLKNLFMPTFFVLVYFLVNLTLGSWLVPRDYGWNKWFTEIALSIDYYNIIVPFLLASNLILFFLSRATLRRCKLRLRLAIRSSTRPPQWCSATDSSNRPRTPRARTRTYRFRRMAPRRVPSKIRTPRCRPRPR